MEVAMVEAVLKSIKRDGCGVSHGCDKNSLKRGKRSGGRNNGGVKQETEVASDRGGEDWGGGKKEGRVVDFR
jgi:hypothetical protein